MKIKRHIRKAKNPPDVKSEFPIVPVMAMFLVFAGLGVFIYWDRRRRMMPNTQRPGLTNNFTPTTYRLGPQAPGFQVSNLDREGSPTWVSRDRSNAQIDRWINDPAYWSSDSSNQTNQGNQTGQGNQQTENPRYSPSIGFAAILDVSPNRIYRDRLREIKDRVTASLASQGVQIITELNDSENLNRIFTERYNQGNTDFIAAMPQVFSQIVPSGRYREPMYIAGRADQSGDQAIIAAGLYSSNGSLIQPFSITIPSSELTTGQAINRISEAMALGLLPVQFN